MSAEKPLVGIILGSKSDAPDFEGCKEMLEKFGVPYEFVIHSAHRNPDDVRDWATSAEERGLKVIIAGAGKAAALGGVVASHTPLPVIAVPMKTSDLGGMDSLLSTVQMPSGIPVATVAIDGADNAAILACQMLALSDEDLAAQLLQMKADMAQGVAKKDAALQEKVAAL